MEKISPRRKTISCVLKLITVLSAVVGIILSAYAGAFGFSNELPYMGTVWWILVLLLFLILVGYCYLVVADLIEKIFRI